MLDNFKVDAYYEKASQIPFAKYFELGYRVLVFDFDNTLSVHGSRESNAYANEIIKKCQATGFRVYVLSNAPKDRARDLSEDLPTAIIGDAKKPSTKGLERVSSLVAVPKEKMLYVGDQLLTDVLAAKRFGIKVVLVDPLSRDEPFYIKIKRFLEKIIKLFNKQRHHFDSILDIVRKK